MQLQLQMQSTWSFALCNSQLPITVPPIAIGARRGLLQVRSCACILSLPSLVGVPVPVYSTC
jgi:hypothetical protein